MGQCHQCARSKMSNEDQENMFKTEGDFPLKDLPSVISDADSDIDAQRNENSSCDSNSSPEISLRDSSGSCFDNDSHLAQKEMRPIIINTGLEIPSFHESQNISQDSLQLPRGNKVTRKVSWGSAESDCGSRTSLSSDSAFVGNQMRRSSSLRCSRPQPDSSLKNSKNQLSLKKKIRRTVSLRLYRSKQHKDIENKLPTIYVEDLPSSNLSLNQGTSNRGSKGSLNQALSLLSLNSLYRREKNTKSEKPVQKILRQPTRRHHTVRGLSGLAIDYPSKSSLTVNGLQRSRTLYYPTTTSSRQGNTRRRTYT